MEIHRDGLFENVERKMAIRYRVGELVAVFGESNQGRPYLRLRSGRVVKRVHSACYIVDNGRILRIKDAHPNDMMFCDGSGEHRDAVSQELNHRVAAWEAEDPARAAAWAKEAERLRQSSERISRNVRRILSRAFA